MNNIGFIFIVQRLGKQSKLMCPYWTLSLTQLNLKIHRPCGPSAHAGADLQASLTFGFKPNLLSVHKLTLLIYGDNTCPLVLTMIIPKPSRCFIFLLMLVKTHYNHHGRRNVSAAGSSQNVKVPIHLPFFSI